MSLPTFPEIPENLTFEDSISKILTSIAMEEVGLSHIVNTEGEKLQYVLGTLTDSGAVAPTIEELLEVNESVKDMLNAVSANQMFLYVKMSAALDAYMKNKTNGDPLSPNKEADPPLPVTDKPAAVNGRTLGTDKTGDKAEWVEIARNGGYSLIVRKKFINFNPGPDVRDNPIFQYTEFGPDTDYRNSYVRQKINLWFTGNADGEADSLSKMAPLRRFTVKNTALEEMGTGAISEEGAADGLSNPIEEYDSRGEDVAFALSYGEAANYVSKSYTWGGGGSHNSGSAAAANFEKLQIPGDSVSFNKIWLRSPGGYENTASSLFDGGNVFRTYIDGENNEYCLVQPALWVDSTIFD